MANNNGELTYFIRCHNMVKIGKTTGLKARISQLQTGNPYDLEIIGVTFHPEPELQYRFEHLKNKNEWYHLTIELRDYIKEHTSYPGKQEECKEPTHIAFGGDTYSIYKERRQSHPVYYSIRELEREKGVANIDDIIERVQKIEPKYSLSDIEQEIAKLLHEAKICTKRDRKGDFWATEEVTGTQRAEMVRELEKLGKEAGV